VSDDLLTLLSFILTLTFVLVVQDSAASGMSCSALIYAAETRHNAAAAERRVESRVPSRNPDVAAVETTTGISSLPQEVYVEIIKLCRDKNWESRRLHDEGLPFPILASQVCSRWRTTVIHTPSLWTMVDILSSQSSRILKVYLERSKGALLNLSFSHLVSAYPSKFDGSFMASHIGRLRSLHIESYSPAHIFQIIRYFTHASAPQLTKISIERSSLDGWKESQLFALDGYYQILRGGTPLLSSITLKGFSLHCCLPPLSALTSLHLERGPAMAMSYGRFRAVLLEPLSLAHLVIIGPIFDSPHKINNCATIELLSLRSLHIGYGPDGYIYENDEYFIEDISSKLFAPNLECLSLSIDWNSDSGNFIHSFIRPLEMQQTAARYPAVRSLRITNNGAVRSFDEDIVTNLNSAFPILSDLTMIHGNCFLRYMVKNAMNPDNLLWPSLRTITLSQCAQNIPAEIVASRITVGQPVSHLKLARDVWDSIVDLPSLQKYVRVDIADAFEV
jgi:hypothetical protein